MSAGQQPGKGLPDADVDGEQPAKVRGYNTCDKCGEYHHYRSPCKLDAGSGTEAAVPQLPLPAPQPASAMAPSMAEAARASADAEERGGHDWTRKANQALDALVKTRDGREYFNEPVRSVLVVTVCVQTNSSPSSC